MICLFPFLAGQMILSPAKAHSRHWKNTYQVLNWCMPLLKGTLLVFIHCTANPCYLCHYKHLQHCHCAKVYACMYVCVCIYVCMHRAAWLISTYSFSNLLFSHKSLKWKSCNYQTMEGYLCLLTVILMGVQQLIVQHKNALRAGNCKEA